MHAYVDELLLPLVVRPSCLILEDYIVVPPARVVSIARVLCGLQVPSSDVEVLGWVQQRIARCNIIFPLFLLLYGFFPFLPLCVSTSSASDVVAGNSDHTSRSRCSALSFLIFSSSRSSSAVSSSSSLPRISLECLMGRVGEIIPLILGTIAP